METSPEWVQFERQIRDHFPKVQDTSGSGATWGDGDGLTAEICFEAKRHQRVSFDAWWKQTRRQAEKWHKVPCLVIWRPPVELQFGKALDDECLAVVPLEYLGELNKRTKELEELKAKLKKWEEGARSNFHDFEHDAWYCIDCREYHPRDTCND